MMGHDTMVEQGRGSVQILLDGDVVAEVGGTYVTEIRSASPRGGLDIFTDFQVDRELIYEVPRPGLLWHRLVREDDVVLWESLERRAVMVQDSVSVEPLKLKTDTV